MKTTFSLTFAFVILISIISYAQSQPKVNCVDAIEYPDKVMTVYGKVDQVFITRTNKIFLCMGGDYRLADFKAIIESENSKKIKFAKDLEGKEIEVTGKIVIYNLLPQITVTQPEQIKIIDKKN